MTGDGFNTERTGEQLDNVGMRLIERHIKVALAQTANPYANEDSVSRGIHERNDELSFDPYAGSAPKLVNNGPELVPGYDEIAGSLLINKIPDATPTDVLKVYGIIVNSVTPDGK